MKRFDRYIRKIPARRFLMSVLLCAVSGAAVSAWFLVYHGHSEGTGRVENSPVARAAPDVVGKCFRTPMGEPATAIARNGDEIDLRLPDGSPTTYLLDQLTPSECGSAPAPLN